MLRSMGSQRVGHHLAPEQQQQCMMMGRSFQTWVLVWTVPEQLRGQAVYLQCNMLSRPFSCQPSLPHGTRLSGALAAPPTPTPNISWSFPSLCCFCSQASPTTSPPTLVISFQTPLSFLILFSSANLQPPQVALTPVFPWSEQEPGKRSSLQATWKPLTSCVN